MDYPERMFEVLAGASGGFSLASWRAHLDGKQFAPGVWTWIGGQEVKDGGEFQVEPGSAHKLYVDYTLYNANPTILHPFWTGAVTLYDVTHGKQVGHQRAEGHASQGGPEMRETINIPAVSERTVFRLKFMGNQKKGAGEPPESLWK